MNKFKKWLKLGRDKKKFFLEALFFSSLIYLTLLIVPFRYISFTLSKEKFYKQQSVNLSLLLEHVGWSVLSVSNLMNWRNKCLVNAITGKLMLRIRGVGSSLYLGVKKEKKTFLAHAWLSKDDKIILGGAIKNYTVLSEFK